MYVPCALQCYDFTCCSLSIQHVLAPNCTVIASRDGNSSYNDSEFSISHHLINRAVDPDDYKDGWPPFSECIM